jgi:uncharacterized protein YaeQ
VVGYSGRGFGLWWEKNAAGLARCANLGVVELPAGTAEALAPLLARATDGATVFNLSLVAPCFLAAANWTACVWRGATRSPP